MPASADDPAYNNLGLTLTNVLVAAAVDGQGNLSAQSSWGPTHVDLVAYGSTDGATSYAVAYTSEVSGVIAALMPSWSPAQRINHIKLTVQPRSQSVGAWSTTGGLISPSNAVAALPIYSSTVVRTAESGGIVTARGENAPNETKAKAFDNSTATKWLDFSGTSWLQYQFANNASRVITQYTSASDTASFPGRAPKSWVLKSSNDGTTWTTLDTRANEADAANLHTKTYNFFNDTAYKMYRLDNMASNGDPTIQIAEVPLKGPATAPRTPGDFDGDGKSDFGIYGQNSNGVWGFATLLSSYNFNIANQSVFNYNGVGYGWSGAIPFGDRL